MSDTIYNDGKTCRRCDEPIVLQDKIWCSVDKVCYGLFCSMECCNLWGKPRWAKEKQNGTKRQEINRRRIVNPVADIH